MKPKQIAAVIGLLVVIVGAIYFGVSRLGGQPKPPAAVLNKKVAKVDEKTSEIVVLTMGEWMKLGEKGGKFKNPKTGEYTMCPPMICSECKEIIAAPVLDRGHLDKPESVAMEELWKNFKCPKCGKHPKLDYKPTPEEAQKLADLVK